MATPQSFFIRGLALGACSSALLFYFWHTEALLGLQQKWLNEQKQVSVTPVPAPLQSIEIIDLLMKIYSINDGAEHADLREMLVRNRHLPLIEQLIRQSQVDVRDLIAINQPFNAAQLYAALLRIKQQLEKQDANQRLAKELEQLSQADRPTVAKPSSSATDPKQN